MKTRLPYIMARMNLMRLPAAQGGFGSTITLHWTETTGGTVDRQTGQKVGGVVTQETEETYGLVHFVNPSTTGYRVYEEIEQGDAILDMDPDLNLEGRRGLTFEFAGEMWAQKPIGEKLAKSWDAMFADQILGRAVLVSKKM